MPDQIPFYHDADLRANLAKNLRVQNISSASDFSALKDGMLGYMSAAGNKRLALYDIEAAALIQLPRLDRAETATSGWSWNVLNTTTVALSVRDNAASQAAFAILGDGDLEWGSGSASRDVNLFRAAANVLATDDTLRLNALTANTYAKIDGSKNVSSASFATVLSDIGAAATSHTHAAADIVSGTIATARLGSGTANNSTFLRGDSVFSDILYDDLSLYQETNNSVGPTLVTYKSRAGAALQTGDELFNLAAYGDYGPGDDLVFQLSVSATGNWSSGSKPTAAYWRVNGVSVIQTTSTTVNLPLLTASQLVLTDASKNLVSGTSANAYALVTAANYAAMRSLLDLEAGTDFYSISAADTLLAAKAAGAASSTDNAVARFDGTTGKVLQNSAVTVDDNGKFVINSDISWERANVTWPISTTAHRWSGNSFDFLGTAANESDFEYCVMTFSRPTAGRKGFLSWEDDGLIVSGVGRLSLNSSTFTAIDAGSDLFLWSAAGGSGNTFFAGANAAGTSAKNVIVFGGASTIAPTSSPADVAQLWVADRDATAGKAGLHLRSEDGTSHVFSDRVGLGTLFPVCPLSVWGTPDTGTGFARVATFVNNADAYSASPKSGIGLTVQYHSSSIYTEIVGFEAQKANGTSNNTDSVFRLLMTSGSSTNPSERLKIEAPSNLATFAGNIKFGDASGAAGSRIIGRGEHTSAPAASLATGEWELTVFDNGTTPVFRVRYNDGGTTKSVDLGPLI